MRPDNMPRPHTPEFGDTQPKLTDAQVLQAIDVAETWAHQVSEQSLERVARGISDAAVGVSISLSKARTAVAGIIAERDALLRACERKNAALGVACDRMASLSTRAHDYFLQQYATDVAYNKAAIAYTGTEE